MNLDDDSLYLLDQSYHIKTKIIQKCSENNIIKKQELLEQLINYSIALHNSTGNHITDIQNKNNLNICKLITSIQEQKIIKKTYKIPKDFYLGIINKGKEKEDIKNQFKNLAGGQNRMQKEGKEEDKAINYRDPDVKQKEKNQDGFVTANLLQKNKLPTNNNNNNNNSSNNSNNSNNGNSHANNNSMIPSVRKKFVPPFKKQEPEIMDQNQQKIDTKDPRYKNLDPKLIESIESEILESGSATRWSDIAGLGFAKKTIHEMIVWPILRPDIFTGIRAPPKGVLLFGPPGTGKTLIGKAIASQSGSTFFNISASSLTSKWVGEGQKMVKTLFAVALVKQPSVIFIDEIDSLLCSRSQNEQESSRRIKTQFLVQLDGAKSNTNERILIIGATNRPNELDEAVRRRFVKKLYIPLPNKIGRVQLFRKISQEDGFVLNEEDIQQMAALTKGYSGADLHNLCSQGALIPIRKVDIHSVLNHDVPKTGIQDLKEAIRSVKATVNSKQLGVYEDWNKQFGSYQLEASMEIDS